MSFAPLLACDPCDRLEHGDPINARDAIGGSYGPSDLVRLQWADQLPAYFGMRAKFSECGALLLELLHPILAEGGDAAVDFEIDRAAAADGTTVSAWIAETAAHRLRLESGRRGIAEWEHEHGALTAEELADGLARARAILAAAAPRRRVS